MINKTSDEVRNEILSRSPYSLPMRPSEAGMKPEEIKKTFWQWLLSEDRASLFGEFDRVVDETNEEFEKRKAEIAGELPILERLVIEAGEQIEEIRLYYDVLMPKLESLLEDAEKASLDAKESIEDAMAYLDMKLDKMSEPFFIDGIYRKVYGVTHEGEQTHFYATSMPSVDSIALYRQGGILKSNAPILNRDVATKKYTDEMTMLKYGEGFQAGTDMADKIADDRAEELYFGKNCNKIRAYAFQNLTSLKKVYLEKRYIEGIFNMSFAGCSSLEEVAMLIPGEIGRLEANAFKDCSALLEINFSKCLSIPVLEDANAFAGLPTSYVIKVPHNLYNEWLEAEQWADVASHIRQADEHSYTVSVVDPICTEYGYTVYTCDCGYGYTVMNPAANRVLLNLSFDTEHTSLLDYVKNTEGIAPFSCGEQYSNYGYIENGVWYNGPVYDQVLFDERLGLDQLDIFTISLDFRRAGTGYILGWGAATPKNADGSVGQVTSYRFQLKIDETGQLQIYNHYVHLSYLDKNLVSFKFDRTDVWYHMDIIVNVADPKLTIYAGQWADETLTELNGYALVGSTYSLSFHDMTGLTHSCFRLSDKYGLAAVDNFKISTLGGHSYVDGVCETCGCECPHIHQEYEESEASCTEEGYSITTCRDCGLTLEYETTSALEHIWSDWEASAEASCTSGSKETRYCERCFRTETRENDDSLGGHIFDGYEAGAYGHYKLCSRCGGREYERHDYTEIYVTTNPTCQETGSGFAMCKCGEIDRDAYITIPIDDADGHDYVESENGTWICSICGHETV